MRPCDERAHVDLPKGDRYHRGRRQSTRPHANQKRREVPGDDALMATLRTQDLTKSYSGRIVRESTLMSVPGKSLACSGRTAPERLPRLYDGRSHGARFRARAARRSGRHRRSDAYQGPERHGTSAGAADLPRPYGRSRTSGDSQTMSMGAPPSVGYEPRPS